MIYKVCIVFCYLSITVATAQQIRYAPAWFGPNANPVPEITDAQVAGFTTVDIGAKYSFGFGDETKTTCIQVEVPIVSKLVSMKLWSAVYEKYSVQPELAIKRGMTNNIYNGSGMGDIYVQTKIRLLKETIHIPNLILYTTIKTSSGSGFTERRYFNTAGYNFSIESGKSYKIKNKITDEIRWVNTIGFMCWETINHTQNDAILYATKIIISKKKMEWEGGISGYSGWMHSHAQFGSNYGDQPVVINTRLSFKNNKNKYNLNYQYGLRDFPYHEIKAGIQLTSNKLTPKNRE